jgi:hypothetical protein
VIILKRKVRFWKKAKLFYRFLLEREGYGLEAACDLCNSSKIDKIEGKVIALDRNTRKYQAKYKCMNCGALADVNEIWRKS